MSMEEKYTKMLKLRVVRGLVLTSHPIIKQDSIEAAMDYRAKDGDVVLVTYPKTGSTWLMYIVWEILHKGQPYHGPAKMHLKCVPMIDVLGPGHIEALSHPRVFRTHFPCHYMNLNRNAKYIIIHRNPDDVLASYYHYGKYLTDEDYNFHFFFEAFISGYAWYGDYFDHVLSAYAHKDDDNFLLVSYEQLRSATREEILRIARFLGEEYESALKQDEELLESIIEVTSFEHMKARVKMEVLRDPKKQGPIDFFRKGEIGDGKNHLNEEERQRLNEKIVEKMKGTDLCQTWLVRDDFRRQT